LRGWWGRTVGSLGYDADHTGWGVLSANGWVARNKRVLKIVLAVALFVAAFRWPHPTTALLFWLVVLALVVLIIIDFYGREPSQSPASGGAAARDG